MCLISFLKFHLLYIQILPSVCAHQPAAAGRQLNPPQLLQSPCGLQSSVTALSHPAKDMQGESLDLSRHLGTEGTQAAAELCWALL